MRAPPLDRLGSFGLATLLHAAAGMALFLLPPPGGGGRHGNAHADRHGVLVVELIPLDHGSQASAAMASDAPAPRASLQPVPRWEKQMAMPASSARASSGLDAPAILGHPTQSADQRQEMSDLSGRSAITYRDRLLGHIARFRQYPPDAHRDHLEGSVEVRFLLNRDGSVADVWIVTSSGRQTFDREALAAIRRAVPMPVIPPDLPESLDISLPIDFEID